MGYMSQHAQKLEWVADTFKTLSVITFVLTIVGVAAGVINLVHPFNIPVRGNGINLDGQTIQFLGIVNVIGIAIGGTITTFLFRAGYIVSAFLSDFAAGLAAQQIRREHKAKAPNN